MGATHVTVTIRNPAQPDSSWEGLFLVDTGAIDSLVPRDRLEAIGLHEKAQRTYELADGSEPILGVTALESVGIDVDPRNQTLKRMPATRLKNLKLKA